MRVGVRALIALVIGWGAVGTFAPSVARADPLSKPTAAEARNHLALGNKLYNIRSFEEAAVEYKAGALVEPAPVFDYNLGQCYRLTGKYQDAIWHYERFLTRGAPKGRLLEDVTNFIAQMKSELDKKAMTQKPTEPAPPTAVAVPQAHSSPSVQATQEQAVHGDKEVWYKDSLGWGISALGVVGLAVGTGLMVNASSVNDDANASSSQQKYNQLHDKADTRRLIGVGVGIAGVGLLATGLVRLAIHSKEPVHLAAWGIDASNKGVMVFGRF